ncbi:MAG: zinc ABC transporter substrate-binding protein AztC [Mesorhizobium sp.]|nr:zinc ABC transporter substrate-binding protein AztC [Mesorhizobium sp.]
MLAATMLALPLAGAATAAEPLRVVATFSIIGDFARQVGGDRIELTTLVGPDGDAHVYAPKPQDAVVLGEADVILVNGLNLEGFLHRLVEASGTKAPVVELTKGVEPIRPGEDHHHGDEAHGSGDSHAHDGGGAETAEAGDDGHDHGAFDPHAFQSVANAMIYVSNIADAFCAADAAGCDAYRANAAAYTATLSGLDAEIKAAVAKIPADRRIIITSHDAFGYFEQAYGIEFLAPEGISTESEASAADVAKLIDQVREDKAAAVFVENVTNPRLMEQIASETGLRVGGSLYSDALSPADGPAATYVDMMRHNIGTIAGAITGS